MYDMLAELFKILRIVYWLFIHLFWFLLVIWIFPIFLKWLF
jgi:hypothetical protein